MKKNKFIYIIITIFTFFCFASGVDAATKGKCIYEIKTELSVKITQNEEGTIKYYYSKDSGKTWKRNKKNKPYKIELGSNITKPLNSCPKYAHSIINKFNKRIKFTDDPYVAATGSSWIVTELKQDTVSSNSSNSSNYEVDIIGDEQEQETCEEKLGPDLVKRIQEIVDIIEILIPILLIVYGIIDFGKAIFVGDENEMKKSQSRFIKRLIVAVGFFLVPTVLQVILNIANQVWSNIDPSLCGIKF